MSESLNKAAIAAIIILLIVLVNSLGDAETFRCTIAQGQTVNVRNRPSTKAATHGKRLYAGSEISGNIYDDGKWIQYKDDEGEDCYVSSKYAEMVVTEKVTVIGNGRLKWRKTPGGKAGGYYHPGDTLIVWGIAFDKDGGMWARTAESRWALGGRYISLDYLETEDGKTLSEIYGITE